LNKAEKIVLMSVWDFFFYLICDIGVSFCQLENATSSNLLRGRSWTRSPCQSGGTDGPTAKVVVTRKPNGYEEYGVDSKFKWDIVPWSLPLCRFRTGWSHCELQRRIPIDRITSSRALSRAHSFSSGHSLSPSRFLTPFQRPLLGVPRVRRTVSSRGVIPNPNKLHFVDRCACSCLTVNRVLWWFNPERFEKSFQFFCSPLVDEPQWIKQSQTSHWNWMLDPSSFE